ncbi:MAG TPA: hypothetical protein VLT86_01510 [Vicinamibacterales bacterium]|nr:hypothetical protein [Vicinamibacterales bacterium]
MRFWCGAVLVLLLSGTSQAQEREPSGRVADTKFWLTGAALNVSMIVDTKSTFDVLRRCDRCFEANPYAAPFIARGPAVAFTAGEAFDVGVMVIAAKMKGARRPFYRRTWWILPVAIAAGHVMATRHNMALKF